MAAGGLNQWSGVTLEIKGQADVDGQTPADDVTGYKSLSMEVFATGVGNLRIELRPGRLEFSQFHVTQCRFIEEARAGFTLLATGVVLAADQLDLRLQVVDVLLGVLEDVLQHFPGHVVPHGLAVRDRILQHRLRRS